MINKKEKIVYIVLLMFAFSLITYLNTSQTGCELEKNIEDIFISKDTIDFKKVSFNNKKIISLQEKENFEKEKQTEKKSYELIVENNNHVETNYKKAKCLNTNGNCSVFLPTFKLQENYFIEGLYINNIKIENTDYISLKQDSILEVKTKKIN